MRYLLVDKNKNVVNVIELAEDWPNSKDPKDRWEVPADHEVIKQPINQIGDKVK